MIRSPELYQLLGHLFLVDWWTSVGGPTSRAHPWKSGPATLLALWDGFRTDDWTDVGRTYSKRKDKRP